MWQRRDLPWWILGVARKTARVDRKKRKQRKGVRNGVVAQVSFLQPANSFLFFTRFYYILRIWGFYFGTGIGALETFAYSYGIWVCFHAFSCLISNLFLWPRFDILYEILASFPFGTLLNSILALFPLHMAVIKLPFPINPFLFPSLPLSYPSFAPPPIIF